MSPRPRHLVGLSLLLLVALGALLLVSGGCSRKMAASAEGGPLPPRMRLSDFYGFCSALPTPGNCLSDPICQRYRKELSSPPPDLPGCLALCQQTQNALYVANLTNGCSDILDRAADLCDQFCRRRAAH